MSAQKPIPQFAHNATDTDLPEGWVAIKLGRVVDTMKNGIYKPSDAYSDKGVPCLRMYNIEAGRIVWRNIKRMALSHDEVNEYCLLPGDLLVNRVNSHELVGKTALILTGLEPCVFESKNIRVRLLRDIVKPELVNFELLFSGQRHFAHNSQQVAGMASVSQPQVGSFPLLLPPLPEQHRIVAKIEELLTQVNVARDRLAKVPKILKRFRQAVLAAACSGRLTEDWRAHNSQSTPSAEKLLARIREARQKYWHRKSADGPEMSRYPKAAPPNPDFDPEPPDGWALASVDELSVRITSGSRDWKRYYRDDGPGTFIMAQNVRPLFFDRSYRLAVDPPAADRDRERSQVKQHDILVTIVGANTGDVCRVCGPVEQSYVCQSVALIRPAMAEVSPFLELYLSSPLHGQAQYKNWIYGEGRPHLSFDQLRETAVLVPSLEEQKEIIRRVEALFKLADAIEKRVEAATKRADKLTQAILGKAFRGELVPTEAELARREGRTYEPASALLERIRRQTPRS
jgi:type I restriction enzyme S subunit